MDILKGMKQLILLTILLALTAPTIAFNPIINIKNHLETVDISYAARLKVAHRIDNFRSEASKVINIPMRVQRKVSSVLGQIPILVFDGKINAIMDFSGGGFKVTVIYNFK